MQKDAHRYSDACQKRGRTKAHGLVMQLLPQAAGFSGQHKHANREDQDVDRNERNRGYQQGIFT